MYIENLHAHYTYYSKMVILNNHILYAIQLVLLIQTTNLYYFWFSVDDLHNMIVFRMQTYTIKDM